MYTQKTWECFKSIILGEKINNKMRFLLQYHLCKLKFHAHKITTHVLQEHIKTESCVTTCLNCCLLCLGVGKG